MKQVTCTCCGQTFEARTAKIRYCSDECRERGSAEKARQRKERDRLRAMGQLRSEPKVSVDNVITWIKKHYAETGELLSYGRALPRMRKEGYDV